MYSHILITTDGSHCSEQGIRHGLQLARIVGARVVILHVLEAVAPPVHAGIPAAESFEEDIEERQKAAGLALESARRLAQDLGVAVETRLEGPSPVVETVAALAEREGFDLIVMGSHGRSGFRRLVLGSVTEGVLRHTTRPLLVVRCAGEAAEDPAC
jgi:nucleotide-binding universal stress UspA family protein